MGTLTLAILGVTDCHRDWRRSMGLAWDVVEMWKDLAPVTSHRPMPWDLLHAMVALAVVWGWRDIALLLLLGFLGCLRRGEALALRTKDIVFGDALGCASQGDMFISLLAPKMRRTGVRRQHVHLREPFLCWLASAWLAGRPPGERIFSGTASKATKLLAELSVFFGVSGVDGVGVTWSSLRGGGATHRYRLGQPIDRIMWLGRWGAPKTLEHYIQEHAAETLIPELPLTARLKINFFAANSHAMLVWAARGGAS